MEMKILLSTSTDKKGACGVQCHFHQYFSNIVAASFIAGGNRDIRSKPPTCRNK
jgi:hypothetical protein